MDTWRVPISLPGASPLIHSALPAHRTFGPVHVFHPSSPHDMLTWHHVVGPLFSPCDFGHERKLVQQRAGKRLRAKAGRRKIMPGVTSTLDCTSQEGRIFSPGSDGPGWFDDKCLFHPIVVRDPVPRHPLPQWRMYYYGRDGDTWRNGAAPALITTGSVGLATSEDGLSWQRFKGEGRGGAILEPTGAGDPTVEDHQAFDDLHIGCGDVLVRQSPSYVEGTPKTYQGDVGDITSEWVMFYFGGSLEEAEVVPGRRARGLRMRCGIAQSERGTSSWSRDPSPILDAGSRGEWDELFVAWPRIVPREDFAIVPSEAANGVKHPFHTNIDITDITDIIDTEAGDSLTSSRDESAIHFDAACGAEERYGTEGRETGVRFEDNDQWEKMTKQGSRRSTRPIEPDDWLMTYSAIERTSPPSSSIGVCRSKDLRLWHKLGKVVEGGAPGSWDEGGVSRRHVLRIGTSLAMFYEGVSRRGLHAIGLAYSKDGVTWEKALDVGDQPGGPVFGPREGEAAWDDGVVCCPHVVEMEDGSFRLYYVGQDASKKSYGIGVAFSEGTNFRKWQRYSSTHNQ